MIQGQPPPLPPQVLKGEGLDLHFDRLVPCAPNDRGFVPFYYFRIVINGATQVGHINFKVGDTDHIHHCAGHIGYEISEEHRGNAYSFHACNALAPFIRTIYDAVVITASPENPASIRIIHKLGCQFMDEIKISAPEPAYIKGKRFKRRYRWLLKPGHKHKGQT
jgi:tagatose 1,6-diphosphate aldolase